MEAHQPMTKPNGHGLSLCRKLERVRRIESIGEEPVAKGSLAYVSLAVLLNFRLKNVRYHEFSELHFF